MRPVAASPCETREHNASFHGDDLRSQCFFAVGVAPVGGVAGGAVGLGAAVQQVAERGAVERVDRVVAGLAVEGVVAVVAVELIVAAGAVDDVGGAVAGQRVVAAAAADAFDVGADVVEFAGLAVVGAVADRDRQRRAARVVGEIGAGVALQRVGAGAALQRVVVFAALQRVGAVAALQLVRAATTDQRVATGLTDQRVRVIVAGERVGGAAAADALDITWMSSSSPVSPSLAPSPIDAVTGALRG